MKADPRDLRSLLGTLHLSRGCSCCFTGMIDLYERDADGSMNRVGQVASGLRSSIGHPMEGEVVG